MTENRRRINPFIVGDWIKRDKDFFGRADLIEKYLALDRQYCWLIGSRRMGKTSLLRYLQRQYQKQDGLLPLFWDVSGANSAYDLKICFLDSLESAINDFEQYDIDLDIDKLEDDSILTIFRWLNRTCNKHGLRIILLIDESEAFFQVAAHDLPFFNRFKALLFNNSDFFVIIASNHGLAPSDSLSAAHFTAPFLQPFMPPDYLTRWEAEEARKFLQRSTTNCEKQEQILEFTGGLPFLVQMVCFHVFETENLDHALKKIKQDHILDLFFRDDFQHFDRQDGEILAEICRSEPTTLQQISTKLSVNSPLLEKRLSILDWLGFITRMKNDEFCLSNQILRDWMNLNYLPFLQKVVQKESDQGKQSNYQLKVDLGKNQIKITCFKNNHQIQTFQINSSIDASKYLLSDNTDFFTLRHIGQQLFNDVFGNHEALQIYQKMLSYKNYNDLIFTFDDKMSYLPVETLHDGNDFLTLKFKLSRSKNHKLFQQKKTIDGAMDILLIASDTPPDIPFVNNEIFSLKNQLQKIAIEQNIELKITTILPFEADYINVMDLLQSGEYNIIHFAGHCNIDQNDGAAYLYLWEKPQQQGRVCAVEAREIFEMIGDQLRFYYLNTCHSASTNPKNFQNFVDTGFDQGLEAFLGNGAEINDRLSAQFALDFYWHLFQYNFNFAEALLQTRLQWAQQTQYKENGNVFWLSQILWQKK